MVSTYISPKARKGAASTIAGRGLHAVEPISAGEVLARCRRTIDGHDWKRPDLQRRYRGYFSWYLQRKMDGQSTGG